MSEGKKEYIYANLERDMNGQLYVKGSLAKLDAMKSIQEAKSYVQDMSSILSPMAFPFTGLDKGNHFNDDAYGSAFQNGMGNENLEQNSFNEGEKSDSLDSNIDFSSQKGDDIALYEKSDMVALNTSGGYDFSTDYDGDPNAQIISDMSVKNMPIGVTPEKLKEISVSTSKGWAQYLKDNQETINNGGLTIAVGVPGSGGIVFTFVGLYNSVSEVYYTIHVKGDFGSVMIQVTGGIFAQLITRGNADKIPQIKILDKRIEKHYLGVFTENPNQFIKYKLEELTSEGITKFLYNVWDSLGREGGRNSDWLE